MQSFVDTVQSQTVLALRVVLAKNTTISNSFLKSTHLYGNPSDQLQDYLINNS